MQNPPAVLPHEVRGGGESGGDGASAGASFPPPQIDNATWRTLVNAMLIAKMDSDSEQPDVTLVTTSDSLSLDKTTRCGKCSVTTRTFLWWGIDLPCIFVVLWQYPYAGSYIGAVLDQGDFEGLLASRVPKNVQECAMWCTVGGILGLVLCIPSVPILWFGVKGSIGNWIATLYRTTTRTSDASNVAALISITTAFCSTLIGATFGGWINYGGMCGAVIGIATGTGASLFFAQCVARHLVGGSKNDPYATSLKRLLNQGSHPTSTLWPIVRRVMNSTGAGAWEMIIPVNVDPSGAAAAVKIAEALTTNGTIEENARTLYTLLEAHIAGIVDIKACAACVAQVTRLDSEARLNRGEEKNTPAEMALMSAKGSAIKHAALIILFKRFAVVSIKERVYESATCRVYRAEDLETGAIVAIKLFNGRVAYEKEITMRDSLDFGSNVATSVVADLQRYDHHAVEADKKCAKPDWKQMIITTLFNDFGKGAIVMPLADYDLNNRLSLTRIAGVDAKSCISILRPIVAALAKLHSYGVVHADVKPRNVVFVDSTWKLIDLDAAQTIGDSIDTSAPEFKWTSGFASPELARCRCAEPKGTLIADPKMDVFSLGILAFELLTGHALFPQDTCNNSMIDPKCAIHMVVFHYAHVNPSLQLTTALLLCFLPHIAATSSVSAFGSTSPTRSSTLYFQIQDALRKSVARRSVSFARAFRETLHDGRRWRSF